MAMDVTDAEFKHRLELGPWLAMFLWTGQGSCGTQPLLPLLPSTSRQQIIHSQVIAQHSGVFFCFVHIAPFCVFCAAWLFMLFSNFPCRGGG